MRRRPRPSAPLRAAARSPSRCRWPRPSRARPGPNTSPMKPGFFARRILLAVQARVRGRMPRAVASPFSPPAHSRPPASGPAARRLRPDRRVARVRGRQGRPPLVAAHAGDARERRPPRVAWEYRHGDRSDGSDGTTRTSFNATPLVVGDAMYFCTGKNRVIALDAETGRERWAFDPKQRVQKLEGPYPRCVAASPTGRRRAPPSAPAAAADAS